MTNYKQIEIIGDSIVSCDSINQKFKWPYLIKSMLKSYNINIFFSSINGGTSNDILNYLTKRKKKPNTILFIISVGINDSNYLMSLNGRPRVEIKKFINNTLKITKLIKKKFNSPTAFTTGHKFAKRRLEGNKKTHNYSYAKYIKNMETNSKKLNYDIIDTYSYLKQSKPKKYCLPKPDGVHLNNLGSKLYYECISSYILTKNYFDV